VQILAAAERKVELIHIMEVRESLQFPAGISPHRTVVLAADEPKQVQAVMLKSQLPVARSTALPLVEVKVAVKMAVMLMLPSMAKQQL